MLLLSVNDVNAVLEELNRPDRVQQFVSLADGELRADWVQDEEQPLYTGGSQLRNVHMTWMNELLEHLTASEFVDGEERRKVAFPRRWLTCTDFYFYTGESPQPSYIKDRLTAAGVTLPLAAFRVLGSVFTFDPAARTFTHRPWLGVDHDPLLRLPYSRKYDVERAQAAETREAVAWEQLDRASDLLGLYRDRVAAVRVGPQTDRFQFPELQDIQDELEADHLRLAVSDIMAMGGQLWLELLPLELDFSADGPPVRKVSGPAITHGAYSGPLGGRRTHFGAASMKRMVLVALDQLLERIWDITRPLDDDQAADRDELIEQLTARFQGA